MLDAVELGVLSLFGQRNPSYFAPHAAAQIVLLAEKGCISIEFVPESGEVSFRNLTTHLAFRELSFSQQTIMLFLFGGELAIKKTTLGAYGGSSLLWKLHRDLRKRMHAAGLLKTSRRSMYVRAACLVGSLALWLILLGLEAPGDVQFAAFLAAAVTTVMFAASGLRTPPFRRTREGDVAWKEAVTHLHQLPRTGLVSKLVRSHSAASWNGLEWHEWLCLPEGTRQPALAAREAAELLLQIFSAQPGTAFTRYGVGSG